MHALERIILFDGECNLCNSAVQFIIKRDKKKRYKFASLQSAAGKKLTAAYNVPQNYDSIVLIENGKAWLKSAAVLRVSRHLTGFWRFLYPLLAVPGFIRNSIYDIVARNRYKWFGKQNECWVPDAELTTRFIN